MKIVAFAGSNSKNSINKKLASYASFLVQGAEVNVLDLNDYELPIYSIDIENEIGIPQLAQDFVNELASADGIVISLAEHNGNYTVAFKNLLDWMSRIERKFFQDKPMLLMSTSPGGGGAKSVFGIAKNSFPHFGGNVVGEFSLPSFLDNFSQTELGMANEEFDAELKKQVAILAESINKK